MENLENIIGEGVKNWKDNYVLSVPFILNVILSYVLQLLFVIVIVFFVILLVMIPSSILGGVDFFHLDIALQNILLTAVVLSTVSIAFLVVYLLVGSFLVCGATGMSLDILQKGETSVSRMLVYGRRYFRILFPANILVLLILVFGEIIISGVFFGVPYETDLLSRDNSMFPMGLISVMVGLLFTILYALAVDLVFKPLQFAVVFSDEGVLSSLKTSYSFFMENKLDLFLIWLIVLIIGVFAYSINVVTSIFFNLIPLVGPLVSQLLVFVIYLMLAFAVEPVSTLWYAHLYVDRKAGINPEALGKAPEPLYHEQARDGRIKQ
ncbi:MAG: hypothetical protein B6U72_00630 [Candidatus Altiarchaeales archaeon ex4484_2]|nr:MAG: hypothetical protein B6U72_00630 [Candidatus Altiarchaeales archaeon ex4484_2]